MFYANFTLMGVICIICVFFMLVCVKKVRFLAVLPEISQKVRNKRFYTPPVGGEKNGVPCFCPTQKKSFVSGSTVGSFDRDSECGACVEV